MHDDHVSFWAYPFLIPGAFQVLQVVDPWIPRCRHQAVSSGHVQNSSLLQGELTHFCSQTHEILIGRSLYEAVNQHSFCACGRIMLLSRVRYIIGMVILEVECLAT